MNPDEIIVVTGIPRSGTTLMMRMLEAGGIPVYYDDDRPVEFRENGVNYINYSVILRETDKIHRLKDGDGSWLKDCEGKVVAKWGSKSRHDLKAFGGCCNPMNLAFDAAGTLYTVYFAVTQPPESAIQSDSQKALSPITPNGPWMPLTTWDSSFFEDTELTSPSPGEAWLYLVHVEP